VLKAASGFRELLAKFQNRRDPPPQLELDKRGRHAWEVWAQIPQFRTIRGNSGKTDRRAIFELLAFYELALDPEWRQSSDKATNEVFAYILNCFELALRMSESFNSTDAECRHKLSLKDTSALRQIVSSYLAAEQTTENNSGDAFFYRAVLEERLAIMEHRLRRT
jgi:hypothetical protein